jgi:hypothetical protein
MTIQTRKYTIEIVVRTEGELPSPNVFALDLADALPSEWWDAAEDKDGEIELVQIGAV